MGQRTIKTHCKRGHKFSEENTYRPPDGSRECATCRQRTKAQYNKTHKIQIREINRKFYLENTEHVKHATSAYAKTDRGRIVQQESQRRFRATPKSARAKRQYKRTAKGRISNMRHFRKRQYGLTDGAYNEMLTKQGGLCAVCSIHMPHPQVDHNHLTGKVRALLCKLCNMGLGSFHDSPTRLRTAALYLEKFL